MSLELLHDGPSHQEVINHQQWPRCAKRYQRPEDMWRDRGTSIVGARHTVPRAWRRCWALNPATLLKAECAMLWKNTHDHSTTRELAVGLFCQIPAAGTDIVDRTGQ